MIIMQSIGLEKILKLIYLFLLTLNSTTRKYKFLYVSYIVFLLDDAARKPPFTWPKQSSQTFRLINPKCAFLALNAGLVHSFDFLKIYLHLDISLISHTWFV